jgi:predicted DNA-binding transcriptional regulator YafY
VLDPTARTLRLLSLLQTHKFWPGGELADRLEVSARTLRRDIDRLRELGYPVDATPGVAGGYRLATGSHLPPLLLDDDEAVAIAVGLRAAAGAAVEGIEDTAIGALAKLEQVLPDRLRRRVNALHSNVAVLRWSGQESLVDPEALAVIALACRDREEVRFDYERRDGEQSSRLVQPQQLVSVGRRWYLVAWDVRRDDWRTFRLDRLSRARLAGARFDARQLPTENAAEFVARSFRTMPMPHHAVVHVSATEAELADVARWLESEAEVMDDGTCRLELRSDALGWLVSMVTTLAVRFDVRVEGSPELLELLAATAGRLGRGIPDTR